MSHVWSFDVDGLWAAHEFPSGKRGVRLEFGRAVSLFERLGGESCDYLIVASGEQGNARWLLMSRDPALRLNGRRVCGGIAQLADRDELRVGAARVYFSTERMPAVEEFPHESSVVCPRCRTPIVHGSVAVQCPQCEVWYHQNDERPCYTYAEICATCTRKTDLDRGFEWTPAQLSVSGA